MLQSDLIQEDEAAKPRQAPRPSSEGLGAGKGLWVPSEAQPMLVGAVENPTPPQGQGEHTCGSGESQEQ